MLDIDRKFIYKLNTSTIPMKDKGAGVFMFRCPLCGDSKKNQYKARGYLIPNVQLNIYWYTCHNCFANQSFNKFLEVVDPTLYSMYRLETFTSSTNYVAPEAAPVVEGQQFVDQLICVKDLASMHPVKRYCISRQVPLASAHYVTNYVEWAKQFAPEKVEKLPEDIQLVNFVLRTSDRVLGFQSRLVSEKGPRYVTISLGDAPLAYGLDTLNANIPFYITEGIIDCLHLPNSIATLNGNLSNSVRKLQLPNNGIHCLDNERLNPHIAREYHKTIVNGHKIFIWPNDVQAKDFNELAVKYNYTNEQIKEMVDQNTYSGARAELAFSQWRQ